MRVPKTGCRYIWHTRKRPAYIFLCSKCKTYWKEGKTPNFAVGQLEGKLWMQQCEQGMGTHPWVQVELFPKSSSSCHQARISVCMVGGKGRERKEK